MDSPNAESNVRTSQLATLATFVLLLTTRCLADGETKNYINTVPGYSQLAPCAEHPLSTVVRGMSQGCGENADAITSYTCFCTLSSSYMSSVISKGVSSQCRNSSAPQQVSSAIAVFDAYCDLGVEAGLTVAPLPSSTTPTATPTASSAIPSQTVATNSTGSASSANTRTTAIAAGVAVPLGTIALAVAAYLVYRVRRSKRTSGPPDEGDDANMQKETAAGTVPEHTAQQVREDLYHEVSPGQIPRQEMAGTAYQVSPHEMATDPTLEREILEKDGRQVVELDASETTAKR